MTLNIGDRVVIIAHEHVLTQYHHRAGVITQIRGESATVRLDHHPYLSDQSADTICGTDYLRPEQHLIDELPV